MAPLTKSEETKHQKGTVLTHGALFPCVLVCLFNQLDRTKGRGASGEKTAPTRVNFRQVCRVFS